MTTRFSPRNLITLSVLVAVSLIGLAGCGPSLPPTYPVHGKVVFKGGKPVKGGQITFQLVSDAKVVADGTIQADGTFTLTTKMYGKTREGAAEGDHKVMVEEPGGSVGSDGQLVIRPIVVKDDVRVVPGENRPTVQVEQLGKR